MREITSLERPAVIFTYEIAGRLLSVESADAATAAAINRLLTILRATRTDTRRASAAAATLKVSSGEFELPSGLSVCALTEEIGYYRSDTSYVVRVTDAGVFADASPVVKVVLAHDLDRDSLLFERVISHGVATALRRAGAFELHCAAVIDPRSAITTLIVGPSGSGKSTLALQLAATGWDFSTDDVVLLTAENDTVEAHGLRRHFAVTTETIIKTGLSQFDSFKMDSGVKAKLPVLPQDLFPTKHVEKCMPGLLVFARQTGATHSQLNPLGQAESMKRLLKMCPLTCIDLPSASEFLKVLGKLTRQCRAFELCAGTDLIGDHKYTASFLGSILERAA
jgi:hypothetical protein